MTAGTNTPPRDSMWRHLKTEHVYRVEGHCVIEKTMETGVLYRRLIGGELWASVLWCRPVEEFMDGRFVPYEDEP